MRNEFLFFKVQIFFLQPSQLMPGFHVGPLQLEARRRPLAGIMVPAVGEQDAADIQEQAGDCIRFLRLFFPRSDQRCHRIRVSSSGIPTPSQCGITRAV